MKIPLTILIFVQFSAFAITPPKGFTPLFNGKNLDGWWGLKTEDPEKWLNLPKDKFQEKWEASQVDIRKHWRVENGILINDGKGLFLSTEKNYQDFELLLDYKTVAGADSGIYPRAFLKCKFGTPQKKVENGNLVIKALVVYGTMDQKELKDETHLSTQISHLDNGINFILL